MSFWFDTAVFYQFYPLGITESPKHNGWNPDNTWNGACSPVNRLEKLIREGGWIEHLKRLGITAVYFSPVFQSDRHGYDTRDYYTIDSRLCSNDEFAVMCNAFHSAGIRIVLDGVFNHVGRGFWAFRNVQKNKQSSPYKDWFYIDWNRNSNDNDGFWYEGWEGHYDLVRLNLSNPSVIEHLFGAIEKWVDIFHIDGIRLDVAYCLPDDFLTKLRSFTDDLGCRGKGAGLGGPLVLIGEIIYAKDMHKVNDQMLHSCTNYECYKGIWSSCNSGNLFEIAHSLRRFFDNRDGMFRGRNLFSFVDNHDVSRIASQLKSRLYLPVVYGLLFGMPGVPCIYYGSEWGIEGRKEDGDDTLRPAVLKPEWNGISDFISLLSSVRSYNKALCCGGYEQLFITNEQFIFRRTGRFEGEKDVIVCMNLEANPYTAVPNGSGKSGGYANFDGMYGSWKNLFTGGTIVFDGPVTLPAYSIQYFGQC